MSNTWRCSLFPFAAEILLCHVTELWFPQLPIQHDRCLLLCCASFSTVLQLLLLLLLLYFCGRSCNQRCTMLAQQSVRVIARHVMLSCYVSSTHCPKQEFATCVGVCHNIILTVAREAEAVVSQTRYALLQALQKATGCVTVVREIETVVHKPYLLCCRPCRRQQAAQEQPPEEARPQGCQGPGGCSCW